ncbi:MAG: hypothetical protein IJF73_06615 [Clostridia bacterium]|nr:hypothetical protein [Clostridia bacterium]
MLALAIRHTNKLIRRTVAAEGIRLGRFFTTAAEAKELAAGLPLPVKEEVRLLDVGAGTGILTAAAVEALCRDGHVRRILLDAYECDGRLLPTLADILERVRRRAKHDYDVRLVVRIHGEDFMESARGLAEPSGDGERYDIALLSPPTGMPAEDSPAARFCQRVLPRFTDLAFLFAEATAARLGEGGVMAAILPLSFADSVGAAPLRERLFARAPLFLLTLDAGRRGNRPDKTMLAYFRYGEEPGALRVRVKRTEGFEELPPIPYPVAVFSSECKVLLAKSKEDVALVRAMNSFPYRLSDFGLTVKTGLTIESRYRDCLRSDRRDGAVPLLQPAGLVGGQVRFPTPGKPTPYLVPRIPSLREPNRTMVLVKRAPTKKDGRHLVTGVYLSGQLPYDAAISTDNKLNVIKAVEGEMEAALAIGLSALLSSHYYERYCSLTGALSHVNAAALLSLPLPERAILLSIGQRLSAARNYSLRAADAVSRAALSACFLLE